MAEENSPSFSFADLRRVNMTRCHRWHTDDQRRWTPADWANATAGECGEMMGEVLRLAMIAMRIAEKVGEASNAAKKTMRILDGHKNLSLGDRIVADIETAKNLIAKELADVIIYADIQASELGIRLDKALSDVFNAKSEEYGFPERLPTIL